MRRVDRVSLGIVGHRTYIITTLLIALPHAAGAENWPAWRGPRGDGTSLETNVPTEWSGTRNVLWKTPRPNNTRSYCTPIIRHLAGRNQMVLSGSLCVASYDPDTGAQHWIIDGPTEQYVASLVYNGELLFMTCGYPDRFMQAIRPTGAGNVTDTHVLWQKDKDCSYVPSPIAVGSYFLLTADTGVATCLDAQTGTSLWRQRLGPHYSASLVTANGLVYFLSDKGVMTLVKPGPELAVVARNELGEETYASPAISEGRIFLRGAAHLYCIGEDRD